MIISWVFAASLKSLPSSKASISIGKLATNFSISSCMSLSPELHTGPLIKANLGEGFDIA